MKHLPLFDRLADALHAWHERQTVRGSLYALNDRELADIGITRADISAVANGSYQRDQTRLH